MKQTELGAIMILALVVLMIGAALLTGAIALAELIPIDGHIA